MTAKQLINPQYPVLRPDSPAKLALELANQWQLPALAVVDEDGQYLGVASRLRLQYLGTTDTAADAIDEKVEARLTPDMHYYEALEQMTDSRMPLGVVADAQDAYLGTVTPLEMKKGMARLAALEEEAAVVVVEMEKKNYSLAELTSLIEWEHARILGLLLEPVPENETVLVHLKITRNGLQSSIAAMERYGYRVAQVFADQELASETRDRYDALMRFINI